MTIDAARINDWRAGLARINAFVRRPGVQAAAFAIAVFVFIGGIALSLRARPELLVNMDLKLLAVIAFGFCPLILVVNAAIFRIIAGFGGVQFNWIDATRLTVFSSALNHLPLPGGPVLRIAAMRARGGDLMKASGLTVAAALIWYGASLVYAGLWAASMAPVLGAGGLAAGVLSLGLGVILCLRAGCETPNLLWLLALNAFVVLLYALALNLGFMALGVSATFSETSVISAAGVIGSAASFLPAGIGVREVAGAFLASSVALDPFAGFTATALVQIAMMILLALLSACFALMRKA